MSFLQVLDTINNPRYMYQTAILRAMSLLAPVMEITCSKLLPVLVSLQLKTGSEVSWIILILSPDLGSLNNYKIIFACLQSGQH